MIKMYVNGIELYLPEDISLRVEFNHPAFETDAIPASVSFNFDVPIARNIIALGAPHIAVTANKYTERNWSLLYNGIPILRGILVVTNTTKDNYTCMVLLRHLPENFGDRKLDDMSMGEVNVSALTGEDNAPGAMYPLYAPSFYGDNWNEFYNDYGSMLNSESISTAKIPELFYRFVIKKVMETVNVSVMDTYSDLDRLILFCNVVLDHYNQTAFSRQSYNIGFDATYSPLCVDGSECTFMSISPFVFSLSELPTGVTSDELFLLIQDTGTYNIRGQLTVMVLNTTPMLGENGYTEYDYSIQLLMKKAWVPVGGLASNLEWITIPASISVDRYANNTSRYILTIDTDITIESGYAVQFCIKPTGPLNWQTSAQITSGQLIFEIIDTNGRTMTNFDLSDFVPKISVSDLLLAVKQAIGCVYYMDPNTKALQIISLPYLWQSQSLDLTSRVLSQEIESEIIQPKSFRLKYACEEVDVTDLTVIESPTLPLEKLMKRNLIWFDPIGSAYYQCVESSDNAAILEWKYYGNAYKEIVTGNQENEEEVSFVAQPLPSRPFGYESEVADVYGDRPSYCNIEGVSRVYNANTSRIDNVIIAFAKTIDGISQITEKGLRFDYNNGEEQSIYNRNLKKWYQFLGRANEYTYRFKSDLNMMMEVIKLFSVQTGDPSTHVRRIKIDGQVYVPKQFTFELHNEYIECESILCKED